MRHIFTYFHPLCSHYIYLVYRWFPDGKVIFVAPTKPLVAQQIDACHKTCGIPGRDAAELTGEITKPNRARLACIFSTYPSPSRLCVYKRTRTDTWIREQWQEKRIFYMTPQTLMNDLATGICDPLDVILIVVGSSPLLSHPSMTNSLLQTKPTRPQAPTPTPKSSVF